MEKRFLKILFGLSILCLGGLTPKLNACTNLIVGKKASKDGSILLSYAADSHTLFGELYFYPRATHKPGTMRQIIEWDTNRPIGFIPEAPVTYQVMGNMNEYQVCITETTFGGRHELENSQDGIDYGSLITIALQRSKTAREAIKVMTDLVAKYGYCSSGESFSIADKNEVWIMEMISKGPKEKGAVWVAERIPDNAICAHANQSRIQQIKFNDPGNCLYAKDVIEFAKNKGYFKGADKDFSFQKAYCPYTHGGLRGCEARVWSFFEKYASSIKKYEPFVRGDNMEMGPMPLYVIPDKKLSVSDIRNMMRDHYEGTSMDMTKDVGAGAFHCPYRWRPMTFKVDGKEYYNERAIATQQTGFVLVAQLRSWLPDPVGGVLWFGTDDADMTVFTPLYAALQHAPECYRHGNGDMLHFSWTSSFWVHNWVSNYAYSKYDYMIKDIRPVQQELENSYDLLQPIIDKKAMELYSQDQQKAIKYLSDYSCNTADDATATWKRLGEFLLVKYIDGNVKKESGGIFETNGYSLPVSPSQPGYDKEYYEEIANSPAAKNLRVQGK